MLYNIGAVEVNVFHHPAILAVKITCSCRQEDIHHHAKRVRRTHRRVRSIRLKKVSLPTTVDDPIAFTDADLMSPLVDEIFFESTRCVSRVRALDHHHEKIPAIIKVPVAYWRLEEMTVLFDPVRQVDRRLHGACGGTL